MINSIALLLFIGIAFVGCDSQEKSADIILIAPSFTMNADRPWAEGVVIKEIKTAKEVEKKIDQETLNFSDMEQKIADILDEYIRPAVESDGGFISLKSFENGVVSVILKGACSGCPSSSLTLKQGIEGLLKQRFPDKIKDVVGYED